MERIKSILSAKKRLAVVLAAAAVVAFAGFWFWGNSANAAEYMTAKVERGNLRNTVTATGTLQAVTTVQVGSQASGTISALYADFNSKVRKGQTIAQLDPSVTQAQVQQARANLEQAKAQLQQARASVAQSHAGVAVTRAGISDARARALAASSTTQNQQAGVGAAEANVAVTRHPSLRLWAPIMQSAKSAVFSSQKNIASSTANMGARLESRSKPSSSKSPARSIRSDGCSASWLP